MWIAGAVQKHIGRVIYTVNFEEKNMLYIIIMPILMLSLLLNDILPNHIKIPPTIATYVASKLAYIYIYIYYIYIYIYIYI